MRRAREMADGSPEVRSRGGKAHLAELGGVGGGGGGDGDGGDGGGLLDCESRGGGGGRER